MDDESLTACWSTRCQGRKRVLWQQAASTFLSTTLKWNADRAAVYAEFR